MKKANIDVYDAAGYVRLSKDDIDIDGDQKTESNSVSNQREIVREYIRSHPDLQLYDMYVDDGFSGKDFERPEFKRMMEDIKAGKVNAVICKDLSRFSRDTIEAGEYQKRVFPQEGVRFIAIGDHYDSLTATSVETNLVVPVKNMVNESYLSKTSDAIRQSQEVKMKAGAFIGSFVPYGYEKHQADKNLLVIDERTAPVVREIFEKKIDGMSMDGIAKLLNERGVLSPMAYKLDNGEKFQTGFKCSDTPLWSAKAIQRILSNEVYTGTLIQGKSSTVGYKTPKTKKNEDGSAFFIRVEGTHEAIICKNDFDCVQRLMKYEGRWKDGDQISIFNGVLFCADCNTPMIRRTYKNKSGDKHMYICKTKNLGKGCTRHAIEEEKLERIVLQALRVYVGGCLDYAKLIEKVRKYEISFDQISDYDQDLKRMREEYEVINADIAGFKSDFATGIITQKQFESYTNKYTKKSQEVLKRMEESEKLVKSIMTVGVASGTKLEDLRRTMKIEELDRRTLLSFVDSIWVYEEADVRIRIDFRFTDEIPKLEAMQKCCDDMEMQMKCENWEVITSA
ncbi:MAG: recombinase family protein [Bacteroidales bacterium]|nr:recombinase family protein [Bacteroidales bacterium]